MKYLSILLSTIIVLSSSSLLSNNQKTQLTQAEKKAQKLWDAFIVNRTMTWPSYVNQLSKILQKQKKYAHFLSILQKNKNKKVSPLARDLAALVRKQNLESIEDLPEVEVLWNPDGNKLLNKHYGTTYGALPFIFCERIEGKTKKECWNMLAQKQLINQKNHHAGSINN